MSEAPKRARRSAGEPALQVKVALRGISKPPVWRRLILPADMTLEHLHHAIQASFGWTDMHLHVFSTGAGEYGVPDPGLGFGDERRVRLGALLEEPGDRIQYTYDFGDDWEHNITLEKLLIAGPDAQLPACTAGKGACPPEDCGGAWGYADLKAALADPGNEEHADMLEWLGLDGSEEFDPAAFDLAEANYELALSAAGR